MKKRTMTVKEMIEALKKYSDNAIVFVDGGEDSCGSWGIFGVAENEVDALWCSGEILLQNID